MASQVRGWLGALHLQCTSLQKMLASKLLLWCYSVTVCVHHLPNVQKEVHKLCLFLHPCLLYSHTGCASMGKTPHLVVHSVPACTCMYVPTHSLPLTESHPQSGLLVVLQCVCTTNQPTLTPPPPPPLPGRYFACSTHTLAVNVISKRCVSSQPEAPTGPVDPDSLAPTDPRGTAVPDSSSFMYYVNDGVYGSFNCILYDHVTPSPSALEVGVSLLQCCVCVRVCTVAVNEGFTLVWHVKNGNKTLRSCLLEVRYACTTAVKTQCVNVFVS